MADDQPATATPYTRLPATTTTTSASPRHASAMVATTLCLLCLVGLATLYLWKVGLTDHSPLLLPLPNMSAHQRWAVETQHWVGVNLGGWLVVEPWMFDAFEFDVAAENDLVSTLRAAGGDAFALQTMRNHWEGFVQEEHLDELKEFGVTHVRVPVGYWIMDAPVGGSSPLEYGFQQEGFATGALNHLEWLLGALQRRGMRAVLDLHAAPGCASACQSYAGVDCEAPDFWYGAPGASGVARCGGGAPYGSERNGSVPWMALGLQALVELCGWAARTSRSLRHNATRGVDAPAVAAADGSGGSGSRGAEAGAGGVGGGDSGSVGGGGSDEAGSGGAGGPVGEQQRGGGAWPLGDIWPGEGGLPGEGVPGSGVVAAIELINEPALNSPGLQHLVQKYLRRAVPAAQRALDAAAGGEAIRLLLNFIQPNDEGAAPWVARNVKAAAGGSWPTTLLVDYHNYFNWAGPHSRDELADGVCDWGQWWTPFARSGLRVVIGEWSLATQLDADDQDLDDAATAAFLRRFYANQVSAYLTGASGHFYWNLRMGSGWDPRPTPDSPRGRQLPGSSAYSARPGFRFSAWSFLALLQRGIVRPPGELRVQGLCDCDGCGHSAWLPN